MLEKQARTWGYSCVWSLRSEEMCKCRCLSKHRVECGAHPLAERERARGKRDSRVILFYLYICENVSSSYTSKHRVALFTRVEKALLKIYILRHTETWISRIKVQLKINFIKNSSFEISTSLIYTCTYIIIYNSYLGVALFKIFAKKNFVCVCVSGGYIFECVCAGREMRMGTKGFI